MSKILRENNLEFDVTQSSDAFKFEDDRKPKMEWLKAVDIFIEWESEVWLIEVKEPKHIKKMKHMKDKMALQGLESFLYLYLNDRLKNNKSLLYYVVVEREEISEKSLTTLTERLQKSIGLIDKASIKNKYIDNAFVFNESTWNRNFSNKCPVTRVIQ